MRELRLLLSGALVALLIVACSGPAEVPEASAWFSDADLDAASVLNVHQVDASTLAGNASIAAGSVLSNSDRTGRTPLLPRVALDQSQTLEAASGDDGEDLGGYVAYVEQIGDDYALRLVDLDDQNSPGEDGDKIVYRGWRHIQSVAVSNDGRYLAFTAESKAGDYDAYFLDMELKRATFSDTREFDERNISLSLDGRVMVWQGGTPEDPSFVWYDFSLGDGLELSTTAWEEIFGLPLVAVEPSVSGNGNSVAFIEASGILAAAIGQPPVQTGASLDFVFSAAGLSLTLNAFWVGDDLASPSLSYGADKLLLAENFDGVPYLTLIDITASEVIDVLVGMAVEHPFLTADGEHAAFSFGQVAFLVDLAAAEAVALSDDAGSPDSATYWARGNFTSYSGSNDQGPFVRPGDDLPAEGRTVGYHAFEFTAPSDDFYEILSVQNYDGYLNLYEGSFDPDQPDANVIAANDDYLGSWDDEAQLGRSRIVAELTNGTTYVVVTSACGAPGTPCGPSSGSFTNTISDGATPPPPPQPPTELPAPDNSGFNITLRFWNDSLSDEEKAVFETASARWSEVIVGDVENIPGIMVPESATTAGAPGFFGELDDVVIDAAKVPIDGPSGVLARAGAFYVRDGGEDDFLPFYGIMEFDEAEFGPGGFFENMDGFAETIMHEMGHVLGISRSFWIPLGYISGNPGDTSVCSNVANGDDPRYEGPAGNDAWVNDYGASTAKVPIANTGGCGTADSHWREIYLQDELMTGYAQGGGEPLSLVTIGALQDLGYEVDFGAADTWSIPPLPTLEQVSPNAVAYDIEFDFTSAFTNSLLGDVTASITAVDLDLGPDNASTSGCEAADFAGFPTGDIALVQRGACDFALKASNALAAGASGILIGNQGNTPDRMAPAPATFGDPGVSIIGVPISYDLMVELAALDETADVVMLIDTDTTDNAVVLGPQALPSIDYHIAEEFVPLRAKMDKEGNFTPLGGN